MFTRNVCSVNKVAADISEDGTLCATVCSGYLNVYSTVQNKLLRSFKDESSSIKILKISPTKKVISCLQTSPDQVVLNFVESNATKIINPSITGFLAEYILWSPDGEVLAVFSSHSMFIDIFKIGVNSADVVATINGAKVNRDKCPIAQFSYDGELFATVNVCNQGHDITVYTTEHFSWFCVQKIFTNGCDDIGGILWCRDSASVLVWQARRELRLELWTMYGHQEGHLKETSKHATCVSLSHCGRLAAILTSDGKVKIIDLLTWQPGPMGTMVHSSILHKLSSRSAVKEPSSRGQITVCEPILSTVYELQQASLETKYEPSMQFSSNTEYIATYEPHYPNTVWVWNLISSPLLDTVVVLSEGTHVTGMKWHSRKRCLAATLTVNRVLVWTPQQSMIVTNDSHDWPFTAECYFATVPVDDETPFSTDS